MLSSITPLGRRGRRSSWRRTVIGFWAGALFAGAVTFGLVGAIGEVTGLIGLPIAVPVGVLGTGLLLDFIGATPPGPRRQVNEDWLGRYRDWVTGAGFGAQLGSGVSTIVTTYAIWALLVVAALVGLPEAIVLGAGFATGRSLPLLATRRVSRPGELAGLMSRLAGLEGTAKPLLLAGYALALVAMVPHV